MLGKFYSTLIVVLSIGVITNQSQGQTIIQKNDMPLLGDIYTTSIINVVTDSIDLNATGSGQNWDFCFLEGQDQQTDTFVSVASTPLAYQFYFNNPILYPNHQATYAIPGQEFDFGAVFSMTNVYNYYKSDISSYKQVGFGANLNGIPVSVRYSPIDYIYRFPLTFGDVDSSDSAFELDVPNFGFYGQTQKRVNTVDGFGQLTTPLGVFQVIRVKSELYTTDTVFMDATGVGFATPRPKEIEYSWLSNSEGIPVLKITAQEVGGNLIISNISYKDEIGGLPTSCVTSISEIEENGQVQLYPNPAQDFIRITTNENVKDIKVVDVVGREVPIKFSSDGKLDVRDLNNGTYFLISRNRSHTFQVAR